MRLFPQARQAIINKIGLMNNKLFLLCLSLLIASQVFAQSPNTSGKCGDNAYWELMDDSLIVFGDGETNDYYEHAPWEQYNNKIKHVVIKDGITSLGYKLFYNCKGCQSVIMAHSVRMISDVAFAHCESLKEIVIPEGVRELGRNVFSGCIRLIRIYVPASVIKMDGFSFGYCPFLTELKISESNPKFTSVDNIIYSKDMKSLIYVNGGRRGSFVIPPIVENIRSGALCDCDEIACLTIPPSVVDIAPYALPNGVKLIEIYNLSSVNIVKKKRKRKEKSRKYHNRIATNARTIHHSKQEPSIMEKEGNFMFCGDELICYLGSDSVVELPQDHNGKRYSIAKNAFKNQYYISDITIPESVDSIGGGAFYGCTGLKRISSPESVRSIGKSAFHGCTGLTQLSLSEGVKIIGELAFEDCIGLTRLSLPRSVRSIGKRSFCGCTGLTQISLPEDIRSIGEWAFGYCCNLKSVSIPSSVKHIEGNPFISCASLENITVNPRNKWYDSRDECNAIIRTKANSLVAGCATTIIPSSVTFIESYAFDGCDSLSSIDLPYGLSGVGFCAFAEMANLKRVHLPASLKYIGAFAFSDCPKLQSVVLNEGLEEIDIYAFQHATSLEGITIPASVKRIRDYAFQGCPNLTNIVIRNPSTIVSSIAFSQQIEIKKENILYHGIVF